MISIFVHMNQEQIQHLLNTIKCQVKFFEKNDIIYHNGDVVTDMGVILEGSVQIESVDYFGNRTILGISNAGDIFAESYACSPDQPLLVDVVARERVKVLFINVPHLFTLSNDDPTVMILLRNLLSVTSKKNVQLSMRIFHSSPKKIRDRLYSYFSEQITLNGSNSFDIPLDRQQLADYLGVDRTALSKELGKMKKDGLINYRKNHFELLK